MLSRRTSRLVGAAVAGLLVGGFAVAAPGPVSAVGVIEVAGACTLSDAIRAVNSQADSGGCVNSPSPTNVIRLSSASGSFRWTYGLEFFDFVGVYLPGDRMHEGSLVGGGRATLPDITRSTVIEGADRLTAIALGQESPPLPAGVIDRGARLLTTAPGVSLTLRNLILAGGRPIGTAEDDENLAADTLGGALYAGGDLVLDNVHFTRNSATGSSGMEFRGASARGGAVYAEGDVVVARSLFDRNRVSGGKGGTSSEVAPGAEPVFRTNSPPTYNGFPGGAAEGADIALAPGATVEAADSLFVRGTARGGSGAPGLDGQDGKKGTRAKPGTCDAGVNVGWTEAGDGQDGARGGRGGDAGDAVGSIAGGASVTLQRSAIVSAVAVTGQAALAGIPGRGGAGGDGVLPPDCNTTKYGTLFDNTAATVAMPEFAGDGGNGASANDQGDQGTAVAAIRSGSVVLSNTTITGNSAEVLDESGPTGGRTFGEYIEDWEAVEAYIAPAGTPAKIDYLDATGDPGLTAEGYLFTLQTPGAGTAAVVSSADTEVEFSTIIDNSTVTPPDNDLLRIARTQRPLFDGPATVRSSILWNERNNLLNQTTCQTVDLGERSITGVSCTPTTQDGSNAIGVATLPVSPADQQLGVAVRTRIETSLVTRNWRMFVRPLISGSAYESTVACTPSPTLVDALGTARGVRRPGFCSPGAYEAPPASAGPTIVIEPPAVLQSGRLAAIPAGVRVRVGAADDGNRVTVRFSGTTGPITAPAPFVETAAGTFTATLPVSGISTGWDFAVAAGFDPATGRVDDGPLQIDATMVDSSAPTATTVTDSATVPIERTNDFDLAVSGPSTIGRCTPLPLTYTLTSRSDLPLPPLRWQFSPGLGASGTSAMAPDEYNALYPNSPLKSATIEIGADRTLRWRTRPFLPTETQPSLGLAMVSTAHVDLADSANGGQLPNGAFLTPEVTVTQADPNTFPVQVTGGGPVTIAPELSGLRLEVSGLDGIGAGKTATGTMSLVNVDPRRCADISGIQARFEGLGGTPVVSPLFDLGSGGGRFDQPVTFQAPMVGGLAKVGVVLSIPGADSPVQLAADVVVKPTYVAVEDPASIVEGTGGTTTAVFPVTLDEASEVPITVGWESADDTAEEGSDYTGRSGEITIPAGETRGEIVIPVDADVVDEGDELFAVRLVSPAGGLAPSAAISRLNAGVTILDDDTASLSVADQSVEEGSGGTSASRDVTISLSTPTDRTVTLTATAAPGSADAGDFTATTATVTIPAGETSAVLPVDVLGDTTPEADETFSVSLSGVTGAAVDDSTGVVTLVNDDAWVLDGGAAVTVAEGNPPPATSPARVTFTLNAPAPATGLVFEVRTADGTARAPSDYRARSATLTIAPGETSASVDIAVVNDLVPELVESFTVRASGLRAGTASPLLRTALMPAALVVAPGTDAVIAVTDADVADPTTGGSGGTGGTGGTGAGGAGGSGGDGGTGGSTDGLGSSGATFYGTLLLGLLATALGTFLVAFSRRRRA